MKLRLIGYKNTIKNNKKWDKRKISIIINKKANEYKNTDEIYMKWEMYEYTIQINYNIIYYKVNQ